MTVDKARLAALLARAGSGTREAVSAPLPPLTMAQQIDNVAKWAQHDPANISRLIEMIGRAAVIDSMAQRRAEIADPMPRKSTVTAGQCSLFDNWPTGKKPNKNDKGNSKGAGMPRYQVSIELWTVPNGTLIKSGINSAFQATGPLLGEKELTKRLRTLNEAKGRPWRARNDADTIGADLEAFGERLLALHQTHPGYLWGPMFTSVGFTKYFLGHYVGCEAATVGTDACEITVRQEGDEEVRFRRFASTLPNNAALPANVIGHSRISNRAMDTHWKTATID